MREIAAPNVSVNTRRWLALIVLLAAAAMLLMSFAGPAKAAPVTKDGKINACYKVKGKPKGNLRLLFKGTRCKRGERKVAWIAAGPSAITGQAGGNGQGQTGQAGAGSNGSSGSNGLDSEAALNSKIATLNLKVDGLEGVLGGVTNGDLVGLKTTLNGITNGELVDLQTTLDGITNGDLTGALAVVDGLTNAELLDAVGAVPVLEAVCDQASALTAQSNLLQGEVGDLVSTLTGSLLGGIFGGVSLPAALDPFACAGI